ncbi:MFS transporter [Paenibacillus thailandensis]|uniref:MFS transporter n=1 Tax=Paenibacillus thailandensis TaxID=393250 RepID=A0ABW5QRA9_9BACL
MNRFPIFMLALGAFLTGISEMIVAGILPFIANDLDVNVGTAGQLVTLFSLSFAAGTPVVIAITSRMDRKKLLLLSLAVFIAGSVLSALSTHYGLLVLSRIILGVSAGVYSVVAFSAAAKLVRPNQVGSAIGFITLGINSAMVLGVPAGVFISKWLSWQANFAALAALAFIALVGMAKLLPPTQGDEPVPFGKQFALLKDPVIVSGFALSLLFTVSISVLNTYMTPYLQTVLHQGTSAVAVTLLVLGAASVAGARLGGITADKWGTVRLMTFGLAVVALSLGLLPVLAGWQFAGLLLLIVWMLTASMVIPAVPTYFIQYAQGSSNLILGLNMSVLHLGVAVGAGAGGIVIDSWQTPFFIPWIASAVAAASLASGAVSFFLRQKRTATLSGLSEG